MDPINLQIERSSSTTRILGLTLIETSDRYRHSKHRTFTYLTFYNYIAAVSCRHFPCEGETEAKTALVACLFIVASIKLIKNLGHFIRRNTIALIRHLKMNAAV